MRHQAAFLLPLLLLFLGCGSDDEVTGPTSGSILVTVSTTGDLAPSEFTVRIDGTLDRLVDANGSVTVTTVPGGDHEVLLAVVPAACTVGGANPRLLEVVPGETVQTGFSVSCTSKDPDPVPGDEPPEPF